MSPSHTGAGVAFSLLLLGCSSGSGSSTPPLEPVPDQLVRDAFGVPHILATSDEGAYYGMGWACAEDRFFQMSYLRLVIRGRTAEVFGLDPGDASEVYLRHDIGVRLQGFGRIADRMTQTLDAETLAMLQAYSDGVNDYVAQAAALHANFETYDVAVESWTPADCVAAWLRLGRLNSGSAADDARVQHDYEDLLAAAKSPEQARHLLFGDLVFDERSAVVLPTDVPAETRAEMEAYAASLGLGAAQTMGAFRDDAPHFSQAWAVAGSATTNGRSAVFADPRLPLRMPNSLWEAHVLGETFEIHGAAPPGSPNMLVGSSQHVAWAVTALGMDQADLFELTLNEAQHPGRYLLDGEWVEFTVDETETILVRGAASVPLRYRETVWGPLATRGPADEIALNDIDPGEEFAVRWVPFVAPEMVPCKAFLAMYRAPDAQAFGPALEDWSVPPANCVFGDDQGSIGYWVVGALPVRSPEAELGGVASMDGSSSALEWLDLVPHHLMPSVLNPASGRILSANHLPVGSWYPIPFVDHGGHTVRSARLEERLALMLPTPADLTDPGAVAAVHMDVAWAPARDVTRLGVHLRDQQGLTLSPEALSTLEVLEDWVDSAGDGQQEVDMLADATLSASTPQASALAIRVALFSFRSAEIGGPIPASIVSTYGFGESGLVAFLRDRIQGIEQVPPIDLDGTEAAVIEFALEDALERALAASGPMSEWADWYLFDHLAQELPHWSTLEALPPLWANQPVPATPEEVAWGLSLLSPLQQTYSQFTTLGAGEPTRIESLLPPGQSEFESSPHARDQHLMWEVSPQVFKTEGFDLSLLPGPVTVRQL